MSWLWFTVISLLVLSLPLSWWIFSSGRIPGRSVQFILFWVYMPLLIAAPFFLQPRVQSAALLAWGVILILGGSTIGLLALLEFWRQRAELMPPKWTPSLLVSTGIYRIVRHPMYIGQILLCLGWYCAWRALFAIAMVAPLFAVAVCLRGYLEEKYILEPKFGEVYRAYQAEVGMFIPRARRQPSA